MDYTEFVDTLWRRAADHIQKSKEDGTAGDGSRPNSSGSNNANLVDIHGHLIDANNEQAIQKEEEIAWKTEQEQISVRDELLLLQAKVDQTKGSVKDAWTIIDYNRALDLLSRGRLVQVFDENDKYHTNVHEVAGKIQRAITMYEEAEAMIAISADESVWKYYPVHRLWKDYHRMLFAFSSHELYEPKPPKPTGYEKHWFPYIRLMEKFTKSEDISDVLMEIDESFTKRNRDKRLEDYPSFDGDGRAPVKWDLRKHTILEYGERFYGHS